MPISFRAPSPGNRLRQGVACLAAVLLAGCAGMPGLPGGEPAEAPRATMATPMPAAPADPLASFVASARPGAVAEVAGHGQARLSRAYTAASGRECREVMLGRGVEERAAVYCRNDQGWAAARPLLRSGTTRP